VTSILVITLGHGTAPPAGHKPWIFQYSSSYLLSAQVPWSALSSDGIASTVVKMRELYPNNFGNNDGIKELSIIPEFDVARYSDAVIYSNRMIGVGFHYPIHYSLSIWL